MPCEFRRLKNCFKNACMSKFVRRADGPQSFTTSGTVPLTTYVDMDPRRSVIFHLLFISLSKIIFIPSPFPRLLINCPVFIVSIPFKNIRESWKMLYYTSMQFSLYRRQVPSTCAVTGERQRKIPRFLSSSVVDTLSPVSCIESMKWPTLRAREDRRLQLVAWKEEEEEAEDLQKNVGDDM